MKIDLDQVTVSRGDEVPVLRDVNLHFDSRVAENWALLGANGAGKSTLLEAILGLLPLHKGSIRVDDLLVVKKNYPTLRKKVGLVFQNPDHQLFAATVQEDVSFGPRNLEWTPEKIDHQVEQVLKQLGIIELKERLITRLSGGEKQRVALAGVLAMQPEAILFDEPTSRLDPRGRREFCALLRTIPGLKILATHDLQLVRELCPQAVVLLQGKVVFAGGTTELVNNLPLLERTGLI